MGLNGNRITGQAKFHLLGMVWLISIIVLFACGPIAVKVALDRMPPIFMGAVRFALAAPVLLVMMILGNREWRFKGRSFAASWFPGS